jgi:hypothetical protein
MHAMRRLRSSLTDAARSGAEFELRPTERIVCRGVAAITKGQFGGRWGPLVLTNERLLWRESGIVRPLRRRAREIALRDIARVDKGSMLDAVLGGRRLRVRLNNGTTVKFFDGQGTLDAWIDRLRRAQHSAPDE